MGSVCDAYGGTNKTFYEFSHKFGSEATLCDTTDFDAIEAEIGRGCGVLYLESPTNPPRKVMDSERTRSVRPWSSVTRLPHRSTRTRSSSAPTWCSTVLHSATKYLGGVICGPKDVVQAVSHFREINGATLCPEAAYLHVKPDAAAPAIRT